MNLLYCGDPQGGFGHILRAAAELQPLAGILLGDVELARPMHEELAPIFGQVQFIHGNDSDACCERVWG